MTLQKVLSFIRRAVDDYHMIEAGDNIAVGISGGKDSLTLLYGLHGLMRFYPNSFHIHAVTVDLGFDNLMTLRFPIQLLKQILQILYLISAKKQILVLYVQK